MLANGTGSTDPAAAPASSASSLNVPAGPRKPARGRRLPGSGSGSGSDAVAIRAGSDTAGQRQAHRLGLLRGELEFAPAAQHALAVDPCLVAVVDAGQHDPGTFVVEQ